jgi:hypothetical protein
MTSKEEMSRRQQALRDMIADEQRALREIYGYDKGVEAERERIIKLLKHMTNFETNTQRRIDHAHALNEIITRLEAELIKGENK